MSDYDATIIRSIALQYILVVLPTLYQDGV
jgi:hypothetical protein